MRWGWVKISKPSPRAIATSVMPAASAVRTASAVGAEIATMNGNAEAGGLLHHLHRHPAGQDDHAGAADDMLARERAAELVQRIVASDVLAQRDELPARLPERRGVDGARLPVDRLARRDGVDRPHDVARREKLAVGDDERGPHRLGQRLDAAQPASGRPREMPPARLQAGGARLGEPHPQLDPDLLVDDLQVLDLVGAAPRSPRSG